MEKKYFDIFCDMMLSTYSDVIILDTSSMLVYILKFSRKPEFEGLELTAKEVFDYLEKSGVTQMADRFIFVSEWENTIKERCENHESGLVLNYRTIINGEKKWLNVIMHVPECYGKEDTKVVFCTKVMDENLALKHEIMASVEKNVYKIGKIYLDQNKATSEVISLNEKAIMKYYKGTSFTEEVNYIAKNLIHPDDVSTYLSYMNPDNIQKYYKAGYTDYGFLCRRKTRISYNWVYIRIIPSLDYKVNEMVFSAQVIAINDPIVKYVNDVILAERYGKGRDLDTEYNYTRYVDRIKNALFAFTSNFETFLEIDLNNNRYVSFKGPDESMSKLFDAEGLYPEYAEAAVEEMYEGEEALKLREFINLDNVRTQLESATTIKEHFRRKTGELVAISFSKTESLRGIPVRVNAVSELVNENDNLLKVITFGNFEVYDTNGKPIEFEKKQSKQVLAYLIDKQGYPITNSDIITDVLEKSTDDLNARKYASALIRKAMRDLENAGYPNVIIKESSHTRINKAALDCDFYHLLDGNIYYWTKYHNEYMKEYSWAEETNSEINNFFEK